MDFLCVQGRSCQWSEVLPATDSGSCYSFSVWVKCELSLVGAVQSPCAVVSTVSCRERQDTCSGAGGLCCSHTAR